jgi:hypothetical protein
LKEVSSLENLSLGGKGIIYPITVHEDSGGEYRYSSTLSLTSVLDGSEWSMQRPGRFTPAKMTRYLFYRRLGRPRTGLDGCGKSRMLMYSVLNSYLFLCHDGSAFCLFLYLQHTT